ncbi:MAG: hypothetical protein ABI883_03255 [Chthoniobacterales bacterium]
MSGGRFIAGLGFAALVLGGFAGCASKGNNGAAKVNNGKVFAVTAEKTSFFRYGPQQGNGADQELPRDTLVTLIRPSFGYSKVQLVGNAQEGYVASEDIRPAPPTLLASLNPLPEVSSSSTTEHFDVQSTDSNYVPPPEALPDPDLPPTVPLPPSTAEPEPEPTPTP